MLSALSTKDHKRRALLSSVLISERCRQPWLAVNPVHHAPGGLIVAPVVVLCTLDRGCLAVADQVVAEVSQQHIADPFGFERAQYMKLLMQQQ